MPRGPKGEKGPADVIGNAVKQHKSIKGLSPAMAAGVSKTLWSVADLAEMVDATLPKLAKRGPYKTAEISN
jgi:hypothetical protein